MNAVGVVIHLGFAINFVIGINNINKPSTAGQGLALFLKV
jgi:hypothetical protein